MPTANDTFGQGPMTDPILPGQGDRPLGCGEPVILGCNECGQVHEIISRCNKRECPECWRTWAHKLATRSGLRMWSGSQFKMKGRHGYRILHIVVSFPHGDVKLLRQRVRTIAKDRGINGGLIIFHPFRKDDDQQFVPDGYVHFHIIGLAPGHVTTGAYGEDYVFKVIRDGRRGDFRGYQKPNEVNATIYYLLTHCGIIGGMHSLTWFGCLSYNQFNNETWEKAFPELAEYLKPKRSICPHCGSDDTFPFMFECEPYIERERIRTGPLDCYG